jgi:GT2 family glycosyltransferase
MDSYKIQRIKSVYNNSLNRQYALPLQSNFSFQINLSTDLPVAKVSLAFATYNQRCKGTLSARFKTKEGALTFRVDMETIKDNGLISFDFQSQPQKSSLIEIELLADYSGFNNLALWVNEKGPCVQVHGIEKRIATVSGDHSISIIMPVYKTQIEYLQRTIQSVFDQIYPHWELCIVDDGSKDLDLENVLKSYSDSRVKVKINKRNKGIALCSNDCLRMATGDFVCFLDHDDLLDSTALIEMVDLLERNPKLDLIYTDEDKVTDNGVLYGPFYKPDWNYTMLLSYMYTCHLSFYRRSMIEAIGGLRVGYEGSQDYDLALRFIEKTDNVGHIPLVLYHWRATEGSTAKTIMNKPEARVNAVRALTEHIERTNQNAIVEGGRFQGMYEVRFKLSTSPAVTIIIPFKNQIKYLENLLFTLSKTEYDNYRVLLVDNKSNLASKKELERLSKKYTFSYMGYPNSFNFSAINNAAAKHQIAKKADYLLFLNNDTEILNSDWLYEMVSQAERPEVSAVGAKLLYVDHQIQHAGLFVGVNGIAGHGHKFWSDYNPGYFARPHIVQEITAVTAACMLIKRIDFEEVEGFEEALPTAFNDVDLCLKLREHGRKIIYTPHARLIHHESKSRGYDTLDDSRFVKSIRFMDSKWGCLSYRDPHYNPNLTRTKEDFSADG